MNAGFAGRTAVPFAPSSASVRVSTVTSSASREAHSSTIGTMPNCVARRVSPVTHGFVARMVSSNQLLFCSLTLSIRTNPGSAKS